MKMLTPGFQAHLDSGTTTLCHCWRVTLKSGERLGFTDHDVALSFDGTSFEAQSGFTGSTIESSVGLNVDNMDAQGALQSSVLDEVRLRAGDFDHAAIEIWRVNWADVTMRTIMRKGHLGEVNFGDGAFTVEVRGLSHLMNQPKGRLYQFSCDAQLGDARCGVNLLLLANRDTGTVASVEDAAVLLNNIDFVDDWATRGTLIFANGKSLAIKRQRKVGTTTRVDLWQALPFVVLPGDTVTVVAGCDKQFETCRSKFNNGVNFRGCPHMPGTDFVTAFAASSDPNNNGGKRTP
jgi:uncharacterized phage protein (TIGR02218 family)